MPQLKIVQWNARSIRNRMEFFNVIGNDTPVIALQESFLQNSSPGTQADFFDIEYETNNIPTRFNKVFTCNKSKIRGGGVSLLVNDTSSLVDRDSAHRIQLSSDLEVLAVRLRVAGKPITVCSLYLPDASSTARPKKTIPTLASLVSLARELPPPFVICVDANGHSPLWGGMLANGRTNQRGALVETWLETIENDAELLNHSGSVTFFNGTTETAIDLTVASNTLLRQLEWRVDTTETYGSDHYPIVIKVNVLDKPTPKPSSILPEVTTENTSQTETQTTPSQKPCKIKWVLEKANWELFANFTEPDAVQNIQTYDEFEQFVIDKAKMSIPYREIFAFPHHTQNDPIRQQQQRRRRDNRKPKPWWTPELSTAISTRKHLYDEYVRETRKQQPPSSEAAIAEKRAAANKQRAVCQSMIRKAEELYYEKTMENIDFQQHPSRAWKTVKKLTGRMADAVSNDKEGGYKLWIADEEPDSSSSSSDSDSDDDDDDDENEVRELDTDQQNIAERFANFYRDLHQNRLTIRRDEAQTQTETQPSVIHEQLDQQFSMEELQCALLQCNIKAKAGPDAIPYVFYKYMNEEGGLTTLLRLFNEMWQDPGRIPTQWKVAVLEPIRKPNKDPRELESFRPIAKACCTGKLLEKMVLNRLNAHADVKLQKCYAFRKYVGAEDVLAHIAEETSNAKSRNEHLLLANVDVKNAFPSTAHELVLQNLVRYAILQPGTKMYCYIQAFLSNIRIRVALKSNQTTFMSSEKHLATGLQQGAILSPFLFNVALMGIHRDHFQTQTTQVHTQLLQYADDLIILVRGKHQHNPKNALENACRGVISGLNEIGFDVAREKIVFLHLMSQRGAGSATNSQSQQSQTNTQPTPAYDVLNISETCRVEVSEQHRILGLILNKGMNFNSQLDNVRARMQTWLRLFAVLKGYPLSAKPGLLLHIYTTALRPRIEYGATAIGICASKSVIRGLEAVQNGFLRRATDAYRTTPVTHLEMLTGVVPLDIRIKSATLKYYAKVNAMGNVHPSKTQPYTTVHTELLKEFSLPPNTLRCIEKWSSLAKSKSPWTRKNPLEINTCLTTLYEREVPANLPSITRCKNKFGRLMKDTYTFHHVLYTDASKVSVVCNPTPTPPNPTQTQPATDSVAYAVYDATRDQPAVKIKVLPVDTIFTAELKGIWHALAYATRNNLRTICIVTDSLSACQMLQHTPIELENMPLQSSAVELAKTIIELAESLDRVAVIWVPAHVGIAGNERADLLAKDAHKNQLTMDKPKPKLPQDTFKRPPTLEEIRWKRYKYQLEDSSRVTVSDLHTFIRTQMQKMTWQRWSEFAEKRLTERAKESLLYQHLSENQTQTQTIKRCKAFDALPRKSQIALGRLKLEHIPLTHEHIMQQRQSTVQDDDGDNISSSNSNAPTRNETLCPKCMDTQTQTGTPMTIRHMLEECPSTKDLRTSKNIALKALFSTNKNDGSAIVAFLEETDQMEYVIKPFYAPDPNHNQ